MSEEDVRREEGTSAETGAGAGTERPYFDYTGYTGEEMTRKASMRGTGEWSPIPPEPGVPVKKKGGFVRKTLTAICVGLLFGIFAGLGFYGVYAGMDYFGVELFKETTVESSAKPDSSQIVSKPVDNSRPGASTQITYVENDISNMVDQVMPAMVSIVNNSVSTEYDFWGQMYNSPSVSSGSGIIVGETDTELLIATNNHVVENATKLEVTFINDTKAEAVIKGTDPDMDLAVIAVKLGSLESETKDAITVATLGDSDSLKLGEPVVAIGNALGYGQSVTNGIVSALNREIGSGDGTGNKFIQTNAAINPGNSGGALLNINGEVIGINSNKIGGTRVEGMGYAIPISSASPILTELMNREIRDKVPDDEVGYMGITMQAVTEEIAEVYGWPEGMAIRSVEENSAAEKAGLLKGDIIVKFDKQRVRTRDELINALSYFRAGDTATITIKRMKNGEFETLDLEITLGERS